jgi:hypothetical protein
VWALLAVLLVAVLTLPKRLARRSNIVEDPERKRTAEEQLRRSMDRLLVELQETAREINATIDTKMIALNHLIAEADRRLEQLGERSEGSPAQPAPAAPQPRPEPAPEVPDTEEARARRRLEEQIYRLADEGKTELEIARITETPRGEVELILSLRGMPDSDGGAS